MLSELVRGRDLSFEEAYNLFMEMREKEPQNIAADLVAMESKGYTAEEIAGFAQAMRDAARPIDLGDVADTCGTGGDSSSTINVSTATSILLSCFHPVAKHGNNSVTSKSGSSNVMAELGIDVTASEETLMMGIGTCQYAYLHAPHYHVSLGKIMPVRKSLGIRTIFNIIGPLCNPARPRHQMIGISDYGLMESVSSALQMLRVKRALVVHGRGLDEVHPSKSTTVYEVDGNSIENYVINPSDMGMERSPIVPCNSARESAGRIVAVLSGKGLREDRNFIILNASVALYATGRGDLAECREMVESAIGEKVLGRLEMIRNAYPRK